MLLGVLLPAVAFAGPYVEVGVGAHGVNQIDWVGREDVGTHFGVGYIWRDVLADNVDLDLGWNHISHPDRGDPFNEREESTNDSVLLILRYEWR